MRRSRLTPWRPVQTALTVLLLAAFSSATLGQPVTDAEIEEKTKAAIAAKEYSEGMSIPVDGSSLEAFESSMEKIKAETTEKEFTTLQNALDYLLIYDLGARRNKEKLASNLDGLTGAEIVERVQWY
jgi:hypothetical protein